MDFTDQLHNHANRATKLAQTPEMLQTEEATKNALVMPFIQNVLGYDVFDPSEVIPEFTADVGVKKGERVDYAILKDETLSILIECKPFGTDLSNNHHSQLFRYFQVTPARIAILTNGIVYRFYSDLEKANVLDEKPFMEMDLLDIGMTPIKELKGITKTAFNVDELLPVARDLKYTREMKRILANDLKSPSEDFVKYLAGPIYTGRFTQNVKDQFTELVKRAFGEFINEQLQERLQSVMDTTKNVAQAQPQAQAQSQTQSDDEVDEISKEGDETNGIVTTDEEREAYYIVKAILAEVMDPNRATIKDTKSYCNVLLDGNTWKQLCRFYLNTCNKKIGLFNTESEAYESIDKISDIYRFAKEIKGAYYRHEPPAEAGESGSDI